MAHRPCACVWAGCCKCSWDPRVWIQETTSSVLPEVRKQRIKKQEQRCGFVELKHTQAAILITEAPAHQLMVPMIFWWCFRVSCTSTYSTCVFWDCFLFLSPNDFHLCLVVSAALDCCQLCDLCLYHWPLSPFVWIEPLLVALLAVLCCASYSHFLSRSLFIAACF